jgi:ferric-dicitrate binding protein FerR (iron transport regulator)
MKMEDIHRYSSDEMSVDADLALLPQPHDADEGARAYRRFEKERKSRRRRYMLRRVLAAAATVTLLIVGTWMAATYVQRPPEVRTAYNSITTPPGHMVEITLGDGTRVWLNARSTLSYPTNFDGDTRRVKLYGEGYFEVKHEQNHRAFVVETPRVRLEVLGTTFNIKCDSVLQQTDVSLLEGSVAVTAMVRGRQQTYRMHPLEDLRLTPTDAHVGRLTNNDKFMWREGMLVFNNLTLAEIAERVAWCYNTHIIINNARASRERYSGKFRQQDGPYEILRILQQSGQFKLSKDDLRNTFEIK